MYHWLDVSRRFSTNCKSSYISASQNALSFTNSGYHWNINAGFPWGRRNRTIFHHERSAGRILSYWFTSFFINIRSGILFRPFDSRAIIWIVFMCAPLKIRPCIVSSGQKGPKWPFSPDPNSGKNIGLSKDDPFPDAHIIVWLTTVNRLIRRSSPLWS